MLLFQHFLLSFEKVQLDVGLENSLATLILDSLGQQLDQSMRFNILMNVKKTEFYHLFFPLFVDDLFVESSILRMLDNILQS